MKLFLKTFSEIMVFLTLAVVAFMMGSCGLAGFTLFCFSTFIISWLFYAIYTILLGPLNASGSRLWSDPMLVVVHGVATFVSLLLFVWKDHFGSDGSLNFDEGLVVWKPFFPHLALAIMGASFIGAQFQVFLAKRKEGTEATE